MSVFVLATLLVGALCAAAYLVCAAKYKKRPELNNAIRAFLSGGGVVSAIRITGAVFTGQLNVAATALHDSIWAIGPDDAIPFFLGGLALGWVAIDDLLESYAAIRKP